MNLIQLTKIAEPINSSVKSFSWERLFIATWSLLQDKIVKEKAEAVTYDNKPSRANQETEVWDVIFAKMQATDKSIVISEEEKNYIFSSGFFILRPKQEILSKYLYYFLRSSTFHWMKDKFCTWATQKAVTLDWLRQIQIPLPSISEQKTIVEKLDKISNLINLKKESIIKTEELIKSVFLEMFGDPMTNSKNWVVKNLSEITLKITDWKHWDCLDDSTSGYYFISAKDLINWKIDYTNTRQILKQDFFEVHKRTRLDTDDVLMVSTWASIWKTAVVYEDIRTNCTTFQKSVAIIKCDKINIVALYLKFFLDFNIKLVLNVSSGSWQKNLLLQDIRKFKLFCPPIYLQEEFLKIVHKNQKILEQQKDSISKLEELYNATMQEVFSF